MSLGSYILFLRAQKDGITPREVAAEIGLPEHYIHAIELEKHAGDADSRGKLADYFSVPVEEFSEYARSTHSRFLEMLKRERRPQMGFLLMDGETLVGTVDGADSSIIKIVELNTGIKTILQRHAIKKWWPLKARAERPGGGGPPRGGNRAPGGGGGRFERGGGGGDRDRGDRGRPPQGGAGGPRRGPPPGNRQGGDRPDRPPMRPGGGGFNPNQNRPPGPPRPMNPNRKP